MLLCVEVLEARLCLLMPLTMPMPLSGVASCITQSGKTQEMAKCGKGSSSGLLSMGWQKCGAHAPNVQEGVILCCLAQSKTHLILNGRNPLFRVWKGPGPSNGFDEEWAEETKAPKVRQVVDEGVNTRQLLDDIFPPSNNEQAGATIYDLDPNPSIERMVELGMLQDVCEIM